MSASIALLFQSNLFKAETRFIGSSSFLNIDLRIIENSNLPLHLNLDFETYKFYRMKHIF